MHLLNQRILDLHPDESFFCQIQIGQFSASSGAFLISPCTLWHFLTLQKIRENICSTAICYVCTIGVNLIPAWRKNQWFVSLIKSCWEEKLGRFYFKSLNLAPLKYLSKTVHPSGRFYLRQFVIAPISLSTLCCVHITNNRLGRKTHFVWSLINRLGFSFILRYANQHFSPLICFECF